MCVSSHKLLKCSSEAGEGKSPGAPGVWGEKNLGGTEIHGVFFFFFSIGSRPEA